MVMGQCSQLVGVITQIISGICLGSRYFYISLSNTHKTKEINDTCYILANNYLLSCNDICVHFTDEICLFCCAGCRQRAALAVCPS
jgi:hypothetical protein